MTFHYWLSHFFRLPSCLRNVVKKLRADINLYDGPKTRSEKLKSAHSISFIKQSLALRNSQSVKSVREKNFHLSTNRSIVSQYSEQSGKKGEKLADKFQTKIYFVTVHTAYLTLVNFRTFYEKMALVLAWEGG